MAYNEMREEPYGDLREYLADLEACAELARVKVPVHWDQEIGAVCDEAIARGAPALLFENIRGHEATHGRRLVANTTFVSRRRVYMALGVPAGTHPLDAVRLLRQRCRDRVPPVVVPTGPCKEVIEHGDAVDLFEFPAPRWHGRDGGRYLQTFGAVVTKDPETGWVNIGNYRGMIIDRNTLGMLYIPTQHWGLHAQKHLRMGRTSMPVAIALSPEPSSPFVFVAPFEAGVCEYDVVGGLRGRPLPVVRCETVDLHVPATAEIVLEGELLLDPAKYQPEGPFGEYLGYYTKIWAEPRPVLKVHCVTHREDPILLGLYEGTQGRYPDGKPCSFLECVPLWDLLEAQGIPGIAGVYGGEASPTSHFIVVVAVDRTYYGQARQIAAALWGSSLSSLIAKYVIVVDADIDITDPGAVWFAIATRTRAGQDVVVYPGTFGGALDPAVSPELLRLTGGLGHWDRVLIDATWPPEWQPRDEWGGLRHPYPCSPERETLERVRADWDRYGIPEAGVRRRPPQGSEATSSS